MKASICADSGALACTKSGESPVVRSAAYRVPRAWGSELNREGVQFPHRSPQHPLAPHNTK